MINWKEKRFKDYRVTFFYDNNEVPECISFPMRLSGISRTDSMYEANLIWSSPKESYISNLIKRLNKYQRYNHFPTTWELWRKDKLWKNFKRMREKFPSDYNYMSDSFVFPEDSASFYREILDNPTTLWLRKPKFSSFGKGISFVNIQSSIPTDSIVTRYITNPFLINNKKFDLRLYVLVTGFSPLKIYLFPEGLVRFATEEYTPNETTEKNLLAHLTNRTLQRFARYYDNENINDKDEPTGTIWSIGALKRYLKNNDKNRNFDELWEKIKDIAIKTILSIADKTIQTVKRITIETNTLFELYGIDVLIDNDFRPWLLEVNSKASPDVHTKLDFKIKSAYMASIFNIVGIVPYLKTDHDYWNPKAIFASRNKKEDCNINDADSSEMQCNGEANDPLETEVIQYSLDEFSRSGLFERIFPLKSNIDNYSKFIENPGKENLILWNWMKIHKADI